MLSINYIKKGCEYAEGFEVETCERHINIWVTDNTFFPDVQIEIKNNKWMDFAYPLFLTRVIEGINKDFFK